MRESVFYFDFISHNAYLAWERLGEISKRHDVEFELAPVVFGALLKAHGQLGPAEVAPPSLIAQVTVRAAVSGLSVLVFW